MLNNIGLPGLLLVLLFVFLPVMGLYSIFKVSNSDARFHYAGFWMRFIAAVLDGIITALITVIPALALGFFIGFSLSDTASSSEIEVLAEGIGNLLGLVIGWIYFAMMESSKHQATLGKKLLGLRVVGLEGEAISFGKASGRHFGKIFSLLTIFIGFFMIGWTKQKQGLHDKIAGCLVVRKGEVSEKNSSSELKNSPSFVATKEVHMTRDKNDFEAEALRRYRAGDLSEDAFIEIVKRK